MARKGFLKKLGVGELAGVGELGIGAFFAQSRRRLITSAVFVTCAFHFTSRSIAHYVRDLSDSVTFNLLLISSLLLLMIVVAFIQSLMFGDLLFTGRWRERVILGVTPDSEESEAVDKDDDIEPYRDFTVAFYAILGFLLIINYWSLAFSSDRFLTEYNQYGYELTLTRSGDSAECIEGIRGLAHPLTSHYSKSSERVRARIMSLLSDEREDVREWSMWLVAELRILESAPLLREVLLSNEETDSMRARAAEALGRLYSDDGQITLVSNTPLLMAELLLQAYGRDELALGLLRGLGLSRVPDTAEGISPWINVDPEVVRAHAYWALGQVGDREYSEEIADEMERAQEEERCLLAEALKFLTSVEDLQRVHHWYDAASDFVCPSVEWRAPYHWDEEREFSREIIAGESLRAKYLKMIFTAVVQVDTLDSVRTAERDFFASIANDEAEEERLRHLARELALRIDQGRWRR